MAEIIEDMRFVQSKDAIDVWMQRNGRIYQYIAVYVDDLCIAAQDPACIIKTLKENSI